MQTGKGLKQSDGLAARSIRRTDTRKMERKCPPLARPVEQRRKKPCWTRGSDDGVRAPRRGASPCRRS